MAPSKGKKKAMNGPSKQSTKVPARQPDSDSENEPPPKKKRLNAKQQTQRVTHEDVDDDEDDLAANQQDNVMEIVDSDDEDDQLGTCLLYRDSQLLIWNIARLSKKWTSPIYAFYHAVPEIAYVNS